jgi:hypothetical protein
VNRRLSPSFPLSLLRRSRLSSLSSGLTLGDIGLTLGDIDGNQDETIFEERFSIPGASRNEASGSEQ